MARQPKAMVMPLTITPVTNHYTVNGPRSKVVATVTVCHGHRNAYYSFQWITTPPANVIATVSGQLKLQKLDSSGNVLKEGRLIKTVIAKSNNTVFPPFEVFRSFDLDDMNDHILTGLRIHEDPL